MTETEILSAAMDKLVATVEALDLLKNLSMAEWLASATDVPPEVKALVPQHILQSSPVGRG